MLGKADEGGSCLWDNIAYSYEDACRVTGELVSFGDVEERWKEVLISHKGNEDQPVDGEERFYQHKGWQLLHFVVFIIKVGDE